MLDESPHGDDVSEPHRVMKCSYAILVRGVDVLSSLKHCDEPLPLLSRLGIPFSANF